MKNQEELPEVEMVSCEICCKEVPKSAAKIPEATDYIAHFCGLDCYVKWQQDNPMAADKK